MKIDIQTLQALHEARIHHLTDLNSLLGEVDEHLELIHKVDQLLSRLRLVFNSLDDHGQDMVPYELRYALKHLNVTESRLDTVRQEKLNSMSDRSDIGLLTISLYNAKADNHEEN